MVVRKKLNDIFAVWQENLDNIEKDMETADKRWEMYFVYKCFPQYYCLQVYSTQNNTLFQISILL